MKITSFRAFFAIFLVGFSFSSTATNQLSIQDPIEVTLDITNIVDDRVPVTINPGRFQEDKVIYRLPRVVQGTYSVSDFGYFVDEFKALDYKGNQLEVTRLDTNSWTITNAQELDVIHYFVNDTFDVESEGYSPFSPAGTNIAPDNFMLNLHGFVGYFDSLKSIQYNLNVVAPIDFISASALQNTAEKISKDGLTRTTTYFAPRYFDITDNPMMYGIFDKQEFMVGDIKIVLSVYSPSQIYTVESFKKRMFDMMQGQKKYLGDINSSTRYDIFIYLSEGGDTSPQGFGALEHHTSTVVVMPEAMPVEALNNSLVDIVAHEFFHLLSPLTVHSEDVHYFDYNEPTFSKHLWMYEGVTEYFSHHFQVYEGLISEDEFYATIEDKIDASLRLYDSMSFTVMSENVLDFPYSANYTNVYHKGALIGMCIDILMREESNGTRSMLSLMKELSYKYGKNKPFEDDALIDEITAMTYPSIGEFLRTHVEGTTPIDYQVFFDKVGLIEIEGEKEGNFILMGGNTPIVDGRPEKGIFFNSLVSQNSFWVEQGVREGDVVKEVDGTVLTLENANQVMFAVYGWKVGQEVEVKLDRDGEEIIIRTTTTPPMVRAAVLKVNPSQTPEQKQLRQAWLKG